MGGGSGDGRGRCGRGPATGVEGVAGVRRQGWEVWLGPDEGGWEVWPGSGDGGGKCGRKKAITKSYQKDGGTPKP